MKLLLFISMIFSSSCAGGNIENKPISTSYPDTSISPAMMPPENTITVNYLTGHFDPGNHPDFEKIPDYLADREGLFLQKEALNAFIKMYEAAKKEGINLVIRSATRNFNYQKEIWEKKWKGQTPLSSGENALKSYPDPIDRAMKILEYSSMPGTSRHHWGTDIDLNSFNNNYFEKGKGLEVFNWLNKHASSFGFFRPYTEKGGSRPFGYEEEKWHWSFFPLADKYTSAAEIMLSDEHISGFKGAETAKKIRVVEKYVLAVDKSPAQ